MRSAADMTSTCEQLYVHENVWCSFCYFFLKKGNACFSNKVKFIIIITNAQQLDAVLLIVNYIFFCLEHPETLNHLFLVCKISEKFWKYNTF